MVAYQRAGSLADLVSHGDGGQVGKCARPVRLEQDRSEERPQDAAQRRERLRQHRRVVPECRRHHARADLHRRAAGAADDTRATTERGVACETYA